MEIPNAFTRSLDMWIARLTRCGRSRPRVLAGLGGQGATRVRLARQQAIQRRVALVHALLHAGDEHAVALLARVEQRGDDDPCAPALQVLEGQVVHDHVARHAVPLERLYNALRRRHLAKAALEPVHAVRAVLDEAPVAAALHLHALHHQAIAAPPPLRRLLRIGERPPHRLAPGPGSPGSLAAPAAPRLASADSSCSTERMLPAGSLNHAMGGPSPRAM